MNDKVASATSDTLLPSVEGPQLRPHCEWIPAQGARVCSVQRAAALAVVLLLSCIDSVVGETCEAYVSAGEIHWGSSTFPECTTAVVIESLARGACTGDTVTVRVDSTDDYGGLLACTRLATAIAGGAVLLACDDSTVPAAQRPLQGREINVLRHLLAVGKRHVVEWRQGQSVSSVTRVAFDSGNWERLLDSVVYAKEVHAGLPDVRSTSVVMAMDEPADVWFRVRNGIARRGYPDVRMAAYFLETAEDSAECRNLYVAWPDHVLREFPGNSCSRLEIDEMVRGAAYANEHERGLLASRAGLERWPNDGYYWCFQRYFLQKLGRWDSDTPTHPPDLDSVDDMQNALHHMGVIHGDRESYDSAATYFRLVDSLDSSFGTKVNCAVTLARAERYTEAIEVLEKALLLLPSTEKDSAQRYFDGAMTAYTIALYYERSGRSRRAARMVDSLLDVRPDCLGFSEYYAVRGNAAKAAAELERRLSCCEDKAKAWDCVRYIRMDPTGVYEPIRWDPVWLRTLKKWESN